MSKYELIESAKPCPFCGSVEIYTVQEDHAAGTRYNAMCGECGCTVGNNTCQTRGQAIGAWNERSGDGSEGRTLSDAEGDELVGKIFGQRMCGFKAVEE